MNKELKIEREYSFDKEKTANFLARIASDIAKGKIKIEDEELNIPESLEVEYELKVKDSSTKIEIEINWKE